MRNTAYLLSVILISFLMLRCQALHRSIPKAERNKRTTTVVENTLEETKESQKIRNTEQLEDMDPISVGSTPDTNFISDSKNDWLLSDPSDEPIPEKQLSEKIPLGDTITVDEQELNKAHELVNKTTISVVFMFLGLSLLLFPFVWITATIITARNIHKFEEIEYVDERDLIRMRVLKILYYVFAFLPLALLLALIILLLLLLI